ncbi:hypothetical protein BI364_15670 [Acidihalobacter yilgarnensis]|uniref:Porin domain-containing protein n=1 Tax=Acidihalobacter yilgarnensis TaxID=2819280 RepID=A0A1D8IRR1_9GAMM|nr:porin [Acidihalobacter yilgarnensis]AOU99179.1 hypothetical protein BI364_15670 [Acidihalobacter yilgarnensis]
MSLKKRFRPSKIVIALSAGMAMAGVAITARAAPTATIYGMVGVVGSYNTATTGGQKSTYGIQNNISQVGVKGDLGEAGGTKFIYNYDMSVDPTSAIGSPSTYWAYLGATGPWGTLKAGRLESTYFNDVVLPFTPFWWMYPTVVANFEQDKAISYVSPTMGGFTVSAEGFNIGKGSSASSKSTNNYGLSGTYTTGDFSFAAGFESFSKYGDGAAKYSASPSQTVWLTPVNEYSGVLLKNKVGLRGTYSSGPLTVSVGGFGFKPTSMLLTATQNTHEIYTYLATASYAFNPKWTVMGNVSTTTQGASGTLSRTRGTLTTLGLAYAPISSVAFYAEYQYADKKAVESGLDSDVLDAAASSVAVPGTKAASQFVIGGTYSF